MLWAEFLRKVFLLAHIVRAFVILFVAVKRLETLLGVYILLGGGQSVKAVKDINAELPLLEAVSKIGNITESLLHRCRMNRVIAHNVEAIHRIRVERIAGFAVIIHPAEFILRETIIIACDYLVGKKSFTRRFVAHNIDEFPGGKSIHALVPADNQINQLASCSEVNHLFFPTNPLYGCLDAS